MALDFSTGIAFGSLVISVVSAAFSYRQLQSAREHNRVSVRPSLVLHDSHNTSDEGFSIELRLQNRGIGPAFFKTISITFDGSEIVPSEKTPIELAFTRCLAGHLDYRLRSSNWSSPGYCLRPGDELVLYALMFPKRTASVKAQVAALAKAADFQLCYCSAYDEEFTLTSRLLRAGDFSG